MAATQFLWRHPALVKAWIFILCLAPLGLLVWDGFHDLLGANPIEKIMRRTGDWVLYFLLITLAVTPLRNAFGWRRLLQYRRMLGLFTFFYVVLHFLNYLVLDQFFAWDEIVKDIIKRPYITVGFSAFVLLIPLAATSTNRMMKRLGKNWKKLHSLIYLIGVLAIVHYLWLVKADNREPLIYAAILVVLLLLRTRWVTRMLNNRSGQVIQQAVTRE
ncbi:MAG: sulfoxide reductase heme-binding subunit YedZ [Gammaproteobacteria bacterium]|nr:sulfoxide reductase heme-binding subunit YedZ [Gammaproteobacteria bacterium]